MLGLADGCHSMGARVAMLPKIQNVFNIVPTQYCWCLFDIYLILNGYFKSFSIIATHGIFATIIRCVK